MGYKPSSLYLMFVFTQSYIALMSFQYSSGLSVLEVFPVVLYTRLITAGSEGVMKSCAFPRSSLWSVAVRSLWYSATKLSYCAFSLLYNSCSASRREELTVSAPELAGFGTEE